METVDALLQVLGVVSAVYLGWRALRVLCRIRWARNALPRITSIQNETCAELRNRYRGCLVGLAIGDALNLPAESVPRWLVRMRYWGPVRMRRGIVRFLRRPGDVSDDTQLTIAVARSIDVRGVYSHERFLDELARWSYVRIGAGRAASRAAIAARRGGCAASLSSLGNGTAIRVAPLVLAARDRASLVAVVQENAKATHAREAAVRGAVWIALLLHECVSRPPGLLVPDSLTLVVSRWFSRFLDRFALRCFSVSGPTQLPRRALPGTAIPARKPNQLQWIRH